MTSIEKINETAIFTGDEVVDLTNRILHDRRATTRQNGSNSIISTVSHCFRDSMKLRVISGHSAFIEHQDDETSEFMSYTGNVLYRQISVIEPHGIMRMTLEERVIRNMMIADPLGCLILGYFREHTEGA